MIRISLLKIPLNSALDLSRARKPIGMEERERCRNGSCWKEDLCAVAPESKAKLAGWLVII